LSQPSVYWTLHPAMSDLVAGHFVPDTAMGKTRTAWPWTQRQRCCKKCQRLL